jgi:hypothetical protein
VLTNPSSVGTVTWRMPTRAPAGTFVREWTIAPAPIRAWSPITAPCNTITPVAT